ncbi:hypothetical protein [Haloferax chudinovii]|uniref:Uncharacterized protein n=1 Tax=Haloferax chudinovii TaxID=1109010 RepID=A0ABD5XDP0_9EURY
MRVRPRARIAGVSALAFAAGGVGEAVGYVVRVVRKRGTASGRTS